jgi:hypothetical protein
MAMARSQRTRRRFFAHCLTRRSLSFLLRCSFPLSSRKKQLKTLYVQETAAAMAKQARLNKANPAGVKKL